MRRIYRVLGNTVGMKKRLSGDVPSYYFERIRRMLRLSKNFDIIKNGDRILEVGTGWLHWEATTIKLFFDINAILFDVWDNRQFNAMKYYFSVLDKQLDLEFDLNDMQRARAHEMIRQILSADSLDSLYKQFGFQYIVDDTGTLKGFPDQSFDLIISAGVMEHINKDIVGTYVQDFYRILKPGGYSIHSINIGDHLYAYDTSVSPKEYLRFSDTVWKIFFQNDVQYINRIQRSEWLDLFDKAGMQFIDEESKYTTIESLKIHRQHKNLSKSDIGCTLLKIVHQRPAP